MNYAEWDDDHDPAGVLLPNVARVEEAIIAAAAARPALSWQLACGWHRDIHDGVPVPEAYMLGNVRDSDPEMPELDGREVHIGDHNGTLAKDVLTELAAFDELGQNLVEQSDELIPAEISKANDLLVLGDVAGTLHGEWVRIHPFAGGNGRTARCWVDWIASRYGVYHLLPIKPRPRGTVDPAYADYTKATKSSMRGSHGPFRAWLKDLLLQRYDL